MAAFDLGYTGEESEFLKDREVKAAIKIFCRQFSRCVLICPSQVDIPSLLRIHMYAVCYPYFHQARVTLHNHHL